MQPAVCSRAALQSALLAEAFAKVGQPGSQQQSVDSLQSTVYSREAP